MKFEIGVRVKWTDQYGHGHWATIEEIFPSYLRGWAFTGQKYLVFADNGRQYVLRKEHLKRENK